jgi:hypothetical protein
MWTPYAVAAEPSWVEIAVSNVNQPGDDVCPARGSGGRASTAMPAATGVAATMPHFDARPGVANPDLPAERLAALALPYDPERTPLEPLRGSVEDLARVGAVLDRVDARRGLTRVAFWGASHVAGEYFTGELRRVLQQRGGDGGHGFVMPAEPWRWYRASDVSLCSTGVWTGLYDGERDTYHHGELGPGGIAVEPAPGASGWLLARGSRFEVSYLRQPNGGSVDLGIDDMAPLRVSTRGDGPGLLVLQVPDGPHRVRTAAVGDGPARLLGVNIERSRGVVVDAMGVVGRQASSWQRWDASLMAPYLQRRPPDLAVLAYGTNESGVTSYTADTYREDLRRSLQRFRAILPNTPCVLIGPSDRAKHVRGLLFTLWTPTAMIAATQREVGPEFGCVTWDLQAASGGSGSMVRWMLRDPPLARADLVHFTPAGYAELATRFLRAWDAQRRSDAISTAP